MSFQIFFRNSWVVVRFSHVLRVADVILISLRMAKEISSLRETIPKSCFLKEPITLHIDIKY